MPGHLVCPSVYLSCSPSNALPTVTAGAGSVVTGTCLPRPRGLASSHPSTDTLGASFCFGAANGVGLGASRGAGRSSRLWPSRGPRDRGSLSCFSRGSRARCSRSGLPSPFSPLAPDANRTLSSRSRQSLCSSASFILRSESSASPSATFWRKLSTSALSFVSSSESGLDIPLRLNSISSLRQSRPFSSNASSRGRAPPKRLAMFLVAAAGASLVVRGASFSLGRAAGPFGSSWEDAAAAVAGAWGVGASLRALPQWSSDGRLGASSRLSSGPSSTFFSSTSFTATGRAPPNGFAFLLSASSLVAAAGGASTGTVRFCSCRRGRSPTGGKSRTGGTGSSLLRQSLRSG
mmetsp:Transcript_37128/g.71230  ORF Transcript_37128/g.71230 Transcript_37128/m.71230 type:complete len:348 (+) Transcript_37128:393-1436(+)